MQSHLVIDFPIKAPENAKALTEKLSPLMPDLAKVQDDLGTVHYSSLWVEGDEKLLFLSDIDGEGAQHIERLVESAGPVFDAIFGEVLDPPVAGNREDAVRWLGDHVRPPLSMYFAYEDASVQDVKACAREAGYTGSTLQTPLLTYMTLKESLQDIASKVDVADLAERGDAASDSIGTLHFRHWVPFGETHLGFFTIFDGDMEKYFQDFADKTSFAFDALFPYVVGGPPTPVAENAQAFYQWGVDNNHSPIGFYSAYPGLSVIDIRALLADASESPSASSG
jgi:hypothetical protein